MKYVNILGYALLGSMLSSPSFSQSKKENQESLYIFLRPKHGGIGKIYQENGRSTSVFERYFPSKEPSSIIYFSDEKRRGEGNVIIQNPFEKTSKTTRSEPEKILPRAFEKIKLWEKRNEIIKIK